MHLATYQKLGYLFVVIIDVPSDVFLILGDGLGGIDILTVPSYAQVCYLSAGDEKHPCEECQIE